MKKFIRTIPLLDADYDAGDPYILDLARRASAANDSSQWINEGRQS